MEYIDVVIPSAGCGTRMSPVVPKQFAMLGNVPVIVRPLRVFKELPWVRQIIVVHSRDHTEQMKSVLQDYGIEGCTLVEGGATRQESVLRGLAHVKTPRVIVHNAAVALVTRVEIERVAEIDADCVTTTTPLEVNIVVGEDEAEEAVPRKRLKIINSPQSFRTDVLRECHKHASAQGLKFASDAELMLHFKRTVRLVPGPVTNFKITTALDLIVAQALLGQTTPV